MILYTEKPVDIPELTGVTVIRKNSCSPQWRIQYNIDRLPGHPDAIEHLRQTESALRAAGAVDDSEAALEQESQTLRLKRVDSDNVRRQVEIEMSRVEFRYPVRETETECWTYYAGIRFEVKNPFPDTTKVTVTYLESAEDRSVYDEEIVNEYRAQVRDQYAQLVGRLTEYYSVEVEQEGPFPLWDKSKLWLMLRFWQRLYHESESTQITKLTLCTQVGISLDTANGWRKKVLENFSETEIKKLPEDTPQLRDLAVALKK